MLRRWRIGAPSRFFHFFTCARPGRKRDQATKNAQIPDEEVSRWVLGLCRPNTAIVSLLGRKPDGLSEFSFYSFRGSSDRPSERQSRPTFQEWLDRLHPDLSIMVREHPTCDFKPIDRQTLDAIASDIRELLVMGRTVVVVDSGGVTRTGIVCKHMRAVEDSSWRD
jgi:hypothetical protein